MKLTFVECLERLREVEETTLIDALGVTSEEIVERFKDIIEDRLESIMWMIED